MTHLKAVVFDWAGTMIDFGSRAPMGVFVEAFASFGVTISIADARGPMGRRKREHVADLMVLPHVRAAWLEKFGHEPSEADIDRVYDVFVPMNERVVADYAGLIPGAAEIVAKLRTAGLKIGSTTGYTRGIMNRLLPLAAAQGYTPDSLVCADDVAEGRPSPLMMYRSFADLGVYPPSAVVKVDDTVPGIAEGLAAGCWTVGVTASGNEVGFSQAEWEALGEDARAAAVETARKKLVAAGAHYVTGTVAGLMPVIEDINRRMSAGESPAPEPSFRLHRGDLV
jgi:phosphonoacetaldehyde hydrolase